jgi:hypothetical protein
MIAPLAPALPPLGAGAHMIPQYYLHEKCLFLQVILHESKRDASMAGKESSHQRRLFPEEFFEFFRPKSLEHQVTFYDFNRAFFSHCHQPPASGEIDNGEWESGRIPQTPEKNTDTGEKAGSALP